MTSGTAAHTLRLSPASWGSVADGNLTRPAVTVVGAWLVLSWNRFGPQMLLNPRAMTRFVLVGIYGWLAASAALWLVSRRLDRPPTSATGAPWSPAGLAGLERVTRLVGLAHQPLVVGAATVLVLQLFPITLLRSVVALISVVLWMPGQLVGAMAHHRRRPVSEVVGVTLLVWLGWVASAGWYLLSRLSHVV